MAGVCAVALAGVFWLSLPSAKPLRRSNPPTTAIIEARAREARQHGRAARRIQHWVPLAGLSPSLREAVVNSEDARFYEHSGVDPAELRAALAEAAARGRVRGASTLSHAPTIARAVSGAVRFNDITSTFASFHFRAPSAIQGSQASAARTPGTLFAAIDVPVPVQQNSIP